MSGYELANVAGDLSLALGLTLAACAFMLPKGWRSPLGMLMLVLGACVTGASFVHAPSGQSYAGLSLARAIAGY